MAPAAQRGRDNMAAGASAIRHHVCIAGALARKYQSSPAESPHHHPSAANHLSQTEEAIAS